MIIDRRKPHNDIPHNRMFKFKVHLITNCFPNSTRVVLGGNWLEFGEIHRRLSRHTAIGLLGLSESKTYQKHTCSRNIYKLNDNNVALEMQTADIFIIHERNLLLLNMTFSRLKNSTWWNNEGFFLIVNVDPTFGCENASFFLKTAWDYNILSAVYVCNNSERGTTLYTFNPYGNHAPNSWEKHAVHKGQFDHPWTTFSRLHNSSSKLEILYNNCTNNCLN